MFPMTFNLYHQIWVNIKTFLPWCLYSKHFLIKIYFCYKNMIQKQAKNEFLFCEFKVLFHF